MQTEIRRGIIIIIPTTSHYAQIQNAYEQLKNPSVRDRYRELLNFWKDENFEERTPLKPRKRNVGKRRIAVETDEL